MSGADQNSTLCIPLAAGDNIGDDFGVVEIEPADATFDSYSPSLIRSAAFRVRAGMVVAPLVLPAGRYVAHMRTPGGARITKLISITDGDVPQQVQTITTSRLGAQNSLERPALFAVNWMDPGGAIAGFPRARPANRMSTYSQGAQGASLMQGASQHSMSVGGDTPMRSESRPTENVSDVGAAYEMHLLHGDAREWMISGLLRGEPGDGDLARWARENLIGLLGLSGRAAYLPIEALNDGGVAADFPTQPSAPGTQQYTLLRGAESAHSMWPRWRGRELLARLPRDWTDVESGDKLLLSMHATLGEDHRLALRFFVPDKRMQAVLDFMQRTDLEAALSLIETSAELMGFKHRNPYAGAAVGYVLLAAPAERTPLAYYLWLCGPDPAFDDIPDVCLQHATLLLQTVLPPGLPEMNFPTQAEQRYRLAYGLLMESLCRGLPVYRSAFKHLVSNLRILQNEASLAPEQRRVIGRALQVVNQLRVRLDISQPFTIIEVGDLFENGLPLGLR